MRESEPITTRCATVSDIPLLQQLADEIWHECYPAIISIAQIDYMLELMYSRKKIETELLEGVRWKLIFAGQTPVGFYAWSFDTVNRVARLKKLYLLASMRGRGLSRQMLHLFKSEAASIGATEVDLTVHKRNSRAIAAYEKSGFTVAESIRIDIGGGYIMDDYRMTCPVT